MFHFTPSAARFPPFGSALKVARLSLLACLPLAVGACGKRAGSTDDSRPQVVCTTGMIADLAREIGADEIQVIQLVRAGVDPHLFSPTRDDVQQLAAADLILYNGLLLEGRMGDALQRLATGGKKVVAVAETLPPDTLLSDPDQRGQPDPHVWMDVALWRQVAETIADQLIELAPEQAETFAQRRDHLLERLQDLDQSIRQLAASVPEPQRVLVTAHDAFGYFGRAYGIEVRGIQGFSTESEAGLRDINEMIDFLIERDIKAVFVESTVSDRNVRALIEGARARGHEIRIGGELYSDSTGPENTPEGTYIGMLEHNARTITQALGGSLASDPSGPSD